MAKRERIPNETTPKGVAVYPKLNEPDTKFNPEGEYSIKLRLKGADAEKLKARFDELHEQAVEKAKRENPKVKKPKEGNLPYKAETDEDGNETGATLFTFKMKAHVKTTKGKEWDQRPMIFDAKGTPIPPSVPVWGGSEVKVSFQPVPYYTAALGAGVSPRLQAVKVYELVGPSGARSAEGYGFDKDEDGFEYEPEDDAPKKGSESKENDEAGDEDDGGDGDF